MWKLWTMCGPATPDNVLSSYEKTARICSDRAFLCVSYLEIISCFSFSQTVELISYFFLFPCKLLAVLLFPLISPSLLKQSPLNTFILTPMLLLAVPSAPCEPWLQNAKNASLRVCLHVKQFHMNMNFFPSHSFLTCTLTVGHKACIFLSAVY